MRAADIDVASPIVRGAGGDTRRRSVSTLPGLEALESRDLLSFLQPFGSKFTRVRAGGVLDLITVSGPGQVFTRRSGPNQVAISLAGTTQDSQVTVSSLGAQPGQANSPLQIAKIRVQTHRLGSFQGLTTVDLDGPWPRSWARSHRSSSTPSSRQRESTSLETSEF